MKTWRHAGILLLALLLPTFAARGEESFRHTTKIGWNKDGWNTVSFPFTPSPGEAIPEPLFYYDGITFRVAESIEPGKGYFFYSASDATFEMEGEPAPADPETGAYEVEYPAGWSLIGNPFDHFLQWSEATIDGTPLKESPYLMHGPLAYFYTKTEDAYNLGAWLAYWVKFNQPVTVAFHDREQTATLEGLLQKYETYKASFIARHRKYGGGSIDAYLDPTHTIRVADDDLGDSLGFTGVSLAAFALGEDWDMARDALKYIADCENPADPGHLYRHPGLVSSPNDNLTSNDMYSMAMVGLAAVMATNAPDDLKIEAERLARNVARRGKAHNWDISPAASGAGSFISNLRYLLEVMLARMGEPEILGAYEEEAWESFQTNARSSYFNSYFQYYAINLQICRLVAAVLLDPKKEGLKDTVSEFYKAIEGDQNTYGDILYHWVHGDPLDFAIVDLSRFPPDLPNTWENNGFTGYGYRWGHCPNCRGGLEGQLQQIPDGANREFAGVDYMVAFNLLRYAMTHPTDFQ